VVKNPSEKKYRRIRIENPRFNQNVWRVQGGPQLMKLAGFKEGIVAFIDSFC